MLRRNGEDCSFSENKIGNSKSLGTPWGRYFLVKEAGLRLPFGAARNTVPSAGLVTKSKLLARKSKLSGVHFSDTYDIASESNSFHIPGLDRSCFLLWDLFSGISIATTTHDTCLAQTDTFSFQIMMTCLRAGGRTWKYHARGKVMHQRERGQEEEGRERVAEWGLVTDMLRLQSLMSATHTDTHTHVYIHTQMYTCKEKCVRLGGNQIWDSTYS